MAFTSETKKELENYISGHLPNKEWYESHFYPFIENKSLRDRLIVEFINAKKILFHAIIRFKLLIKLKFAMNKK